MPDRFLDRRKTKHFIVDHRIIDEYLPAIGGNAFMLYSIYCRLAFAFDAVYPSLKTIQQNTGFARGSIAKYNSMLEEVGLIKIERQVYSCTRQEDDDKTSKYPSNESNTYILLEPEGLSPALKQKYYPANWRPIIKYTPSPKFGQGYKEGASPKFGQGPSLNNRQGLVQNMDPINKDLKNVVVNIETTTMEILVVLTKLYKEKSGISSISESGMKSIFKSALKKCEDMGKAFDYVKEKIGFYRKADDPMAWLHEAVKNDWQDTKKLAEKEMQDKLIRQNRQESELRDKIIKAWNELPIKERAMRYMKGICDYFNYKHRRKPNEIEREYILKELIIKGKYGPIDLKNPDRDFRGA